MILVEALRAVVGDRHVLTDADLRAPFEVDWTRRFGGPALAVVRPASTFEVAGILRACTEHGAAVVPQGGNTGLVGGGVPRGGEVLLSLSRMTDIGEADTALGQIEVGAGATLAALQQRATAAGLDAGLDFAARDSASIGGIVACDAGGARALRYGTARTRVVGLEAVLADGSIVRRMGGLSILRHQRRERLVRRSPVYVLAELAAPQDPTSELAEALARAGVEDAVVADDTTSRERLWALREGHAEAISAVGVPHKLDVGVPLTALQRFLERLPAVVAHARTGAHTIVWGHLGDGNLHVNVIGPGRDDEAADDAVLQLVLKCGGAISAEHGVGTAKARWLTAARGADEVAAMRGVKAALDQAGVLNPGVVLTT